MNRKPKVVRSEWWVAEPMKPNLTVYEPDPPVQETGLLDAQRPPAREAQTEDRLPMKIWLPKSAWTRAAPNVSLRLKIAGSKRKRVVPKAKAGSLQYAAEKLLGRKPKGKA